MKYKRNIYEFSEIIDSISLYYFFLQFTYKFDISAYLYLIVILFSSHIKT